MFEIQNYDSFIMAVILFQLFPGAGTITILNATARGGVSNVFYGFFPLFLRADSRPVTLATLMVHVTAISFLYQTGLVLAGNAIARHLSQWRYARVIATRLAGVTIIGLGVKLIFDNR